MREATINLQAPLTEDTLRTLKLGDAVRLSGVIFTARDAAHKYLFEHNLSLCPQLPDLRNAIFYHCGPVIVKGEDGQWKVTAAGPTTSIREEPYMPALIERLGLRAIIGKGGMGKATAQACAQFGCVYLHAVGGVAQLLASAVKSVQNVYMLKEFGAPEALWQMEIRDFPAVVTMDAKGNSLHEIVRSTSEKRLAELLRQ